MKMIKQKAATALTVVGLLYLGGCASANQIRSEHQTMASKMIKIADASNKAEVNATKIAQMCRGCNKTTLNINHQSNQIGGEINRLIGVDILNELKK